MPVSGNSLHRAWACGTPASRRLIAGAIVATAVLLPEASFAARIILGPTANNAQLSAEQSLFDLGSTFLERGGDQASWGFNVVRGSNPNGGGASQDSAPQKYRSWGELYGIHSKTDPQGTFTGDERRTYGGVVGLGTTVAPGLNVGMTLDLSNTKIDMPAALQSADMGLAQLGFNASYTFGAWTLAAVVVHGWANVAAQRDTITSTAFSNYPGRLDGGIAELSYYWATGQSRIVPKLGVEYVRSRTDAYSEFGGFDPVTASAVSGDRTKILLGAEAGHYWVVNGHVLDLAGYAKFIDNVEQHIDPSALTASGQSITVQGVFESQYGADAGGGLSYGISEAVRVYANYDGKFRQNFTSHQGTLGVEVRW